MKLAKFVLRTIGVILIAPIVGILSFVVIIDDFLFGEEEDDAKWIE